MEALIGLTIVVVAAVLIRANTAPDYCFIPDGDPYWNPKGGTDWNPEEK